MFGSKKIRYRSDYERALTDVKREVEERYGNGTLSEIFGLYRYARERTNSNKPEDALTDSQLAWKKYSDAFHEMLVNNLPPDQKESLDSLARLYDAQDIFSDVVDAQRAVETLFIQQEPLFITYEEKNDPENHYQLRLNQEVKAMLASTEPSSALATANGLLKLVELMKGKMVGAVKNLQQQLRERLDELHASQKTAQELANAVTDKPEVASETEQWIELSEQLFSVSIARTDVLAKEFDLDAAFPSIVVAKKGINPNQMSDDERNKFTDAVVETNALKATVFQKIQDVRKERDPLTIEVFGGKEVYEKLIEEASRTAVDWFNKAS